MTAATAEADAEPRAPRGPGSVEVALRAGVSFRVIDYWVRAGYLRPEGDGGGPGTQRRWPEEEQEVACRMARLAAAGLTVERAASFARDEWPGAEIAPGIHLLVTGEPA